VAGLYLHIPFCKQRCTYCDFYFVTSDRNKEAFVRSLQTEMAYYASQFAGYEPIRTVYFGGGTPSRLPLADVYTLLRDVRSHFGDANWEEVTFEVNPEDLSREYLYGLRDAGVTRLSVGIQSFFEEDLRWMNRAHSAEQAERCIELINGAGFTSFSVDLIFGLPEQPFEYWAANLQKAIRLGAPHISAYSLTVEPRTVLSKRVETGKQLAPDEDVLAERFSFTQHFLTEAGFEQYEISSYAKPGHRAIHNARYWEHANYLAFGPAAHGFWWGPPQKGAVRWANVAHLNRYIALLEAHQVPTDEHERISYDVLANEYILLRLRTRDGLHLETLNTKYGADLIAEKADELAALEREGMLTFNGRTLSLTSRGMLLADAVTDRLLLTDFKRGL